MDILIDAMQQKTNTQKDKESPAPARTSQHVLEQRRVHFLPIGQNHHHVPPKPARPLVPPLGQNTDTRDRPDRSSAAE